MGQEWRFSGAASNDEKTGTKDHESIREEHSLSGFLAVGPERDGKFSIVHGGELFLPVFTMELPLPALIDLAKGLANRLAQPMNEQWDGRSIHQLVA